MVALRGNECSYQFDTNHYAILWISFKELSKEGFLEVGKLVKDYLNEHQEIKYSQTGFVFGKHDIVVEFYTRAARVASYHACEIQRIIDESLGDKEVCSSLVLGNEIINELERPPIVPVSPIRAYTFLNFFLEERSMKDITKKALDSIKEIDSEKMRLVWNASSYCLILISEGNCYENVFSRIIDFRKKLQDFLYESCTFFALKYNEYGIEKDARGKNDIPAITSVKFRRLVSKELKHGDAWYPTWFYDAKNQETRFGSKLNRVGWYDMTLGIVKPTLWEIAEELFELRKTNNFTGHLIHHTSTLLMLEKVTRND